MTLGLRIRTLRKAHRMTQQQLADATDVSRIYIQALESNRRSPSMKLLHRLAEKLDVETSDLLEEFPRDKGGRLQLEELLATPDSSDIWFRTHRLTAKEIITVRRLVEAYLGEWSEEPKRGRPRLNRLAVDKDKLAEKASEKLSEE